MTFLLFATTVLFQLPDDHYPPCPLDTPFGSVRVDWPSSGNCADPYHDFGLTPAIDCWENARDFARKLADWKQRAAMAVDSAADGWWDLYGPNCASRAHFLASNTMNQMELDARILYSRVANATDPSLDDGQQKRGKACIAPAYWAPPVFNPLCQPCFYYSPNCYHNNFAFQDGIARYRRERGIYIEQVYRAQLSDFFGPLDQNCVEQYVSDAYAAVEARINEAHAARVICDY